MEEREESGPPELSLTERNETAKAATLCPYSVKMRYFSVMASETGRHLLDVLIILTDEVPNDIYFSFYQRLDGGLLNVALVETGSRDGSAVEDVAFGQADTGFDTYYVGKMPNQATSATGFQWDKLSPAEFQQLQELASYSTSKLQDVLNQFCEVKKQSPDGILFIPPARWCALVISLHYTLRILDFKHLTLAHFGLGVTEEVILIALRTTSLVTTSRTYWLVCSPRHVRCRHVTSRHGGRRRPPCRRVCDVPYETNNFGAAARPAFPGVIARPHTERCLIIRPRPETPDTPSEARGTPLQRPHSIRPLRLFHRDPARLARMRLLTKTRAMLKFSSTRDSL
ncbi:Diacylglycerol kinase 1 [Eumeta japonica]|uniref:Diacylglycerol kinase 1 n=1 Tax=Eumeta variegata TaxID=151549 RepID=A0A4C1Z1N1_EUMVA|nr:Diacylglycerol kinase 1 [Eumeta japonica]